MSLELAFQNSTRALLAARTPAGHWEGELSSSALSTATAIFAMHLYLDSTAAAGAPETRQVIQERIGAGIIWLLIHQNPDGGWGDTTLSFSNISTTTLCWSALSIANTSETAHTTMSAEVARCLRSAEGWLTTLAGSLSPDDLARAIIARYGKDKTFSVPILTMCALASRLGQGRDAWRHIPQLPFELAALPHKWFQIIRLPVVRYALPALIAMGQARHAHRPSRNPAMRALRNRLIGRTSRLLAELQPSSGGFLEATPLTSFVVMCLVATGQRDSDVVRRGMDFLIRSTRADGSWPIDTNLATWCTTLSINALAAAGEGAIQQVLTEAERDRLGEFLLGQQYQVEHPYTRAAPGGWAWTDLPGGVPDADDTAGAMIALWNLGRRDDERTLRAARDGQEWLSELQNRDGGIPTFCRGWGSLPFDRSGSDLTAHAMHAWLLWSGQTRLGVDQVTKNRLARATKYLAAKQREDGAWLPLWFGNQYVVEETNATYGVSRTLSGCAQLAKDVAMAGPLRRASRWLIDAQSPDGSWGGARGPQNSIEETALAIVGLLDYARCATAEDAAASRAAATKGLHSLKALTQDGTHFPPSPIGFYFAKLWYFERLYPLIFSTAAFGAGVRAAIVI